MKLICCLFAAFSIVVAANAKPVNFTGSTPAHIEVRSFLGISKTDSIDFIRWKLVIDENNFALNCQYGISKGGTPGFINEKEVHFKGTISREGPVNTLYRDKRTLKLLQVNENLLHLADHAENMLVGNGGYSFVLNNEAPIATGVFTIKAKPNKQSYPLVFEGRTPCQELSRLLNLNKGDACNKMKWYILLYADSLTGKPTYYLKNGMGYRKETMEKGKWKLQNQKNGRIIYQLTPDDKSYMLNLLKGDDNILFFIRPDGSLLVGDKDFSYTLNRRDREYEPIKK